MISSDSGKFTHPNNTSTCSSSYIGCILNRKFLVFHKALKYSLSFCKLNQIDLLRISTKPISFPPSNLAHLLVQLILLLVSLNLILFLDLKQIDLFNLHLTEFLTLSANFGGLVDLVKNTSVRCRC